MFRSCLGGLVFGWVLGSAPLAHAVDAPARGKPAPRIRVALQADRPAVLAGRPVWVTLTLANLTTEPVTLQVPDANADEALPGEMGLPLAHVFSGRGFSAITIEDAHNAVFGNNVFVEPPGPVPSVKLAPHGSVGIRLDLTRYYEALSRPGIYKLVWRPYDGTTKSAPLTVTILAERQVVMVTDFGNITLRFHYDEAPNHVQSFIELVQAGFYDNLTFHRLIPGGIIQGGDPRGDGRGVRRDGKRLKAEFSKIPFERGTVGMARSQRDPDSASCQFYMCLGRQPSFDGRQTAFAYVVGSKSLETLRELEAIPTGLKDRPIQPVYIRAISLENVPAREREVSPSPLSGRTTSRPASAIRGRDARPFSPSVNRRPHRQDRGLPMAHGSGTTTRPARDRQR